MITKGCNPVYFSRTVRLKLRGQHSFKIILSLLLNFHSVSLISKWRTNRHTTVCKSNKSSTKQRLCTGCLADRPITKRKVHKKCVSHQELINHLRCALADSHIFLFTSVVPLAEFKIPLAYLSSEVETCDCISVFVCFSFSDRIPFTCF